MKKLTLVLALLVVCSGASMATMVTYDTYGGWNLVSAPVVPFNPAPESVFNQFDLQGNDALTRFDAPTGNTYAYDPWGDPTVFGNILLGDGYWLNSATAHAVSYDGVLNGVPDGAGVKTDMWISLPGNQLDGVDEGGWHLIGTPFNDDICFDKTEYSGVGDNVLVTDGSQMLTIADAETAGWIESTMTYYDGLTQNSYTSGYNWCDDDFLRAGKGYWCKTKKDNLALIVPAKNP